MSYHTYIGIRNMNKTVPVNDDRSTDDDSTSISRTNSEENEEQGVSSTSSRSGSADDANATTGGNEEQEEDDDAFFTYVIGAIKEKRIHKLRTTAPMKTFKRYCELCLPVIVGKQHWKMNRAMVGIRALATVADEALIAIILENNINEWIELARRGKINTKKRLTLYTHGGTDSKGRKKGWSLNGLKRYNTLHEEVKIERRAENADGIEECLKEMWKTERFAKGTTRSSQEGSGEEEIFEPHLDFDD